MKNTIVGLVLLIGATCFAQPGGDLKHKERQEYIHTQKIAFISTELALTTEEAEKFWPVYNEYDAKLEALRKERRGFAKELKGIDDLTGDKAYELTEKILATEKKESDLRLEYLSKFADVLGKKKAAKVFIAEDKFKRELLKNIHEHQKNHDGSTQK